MEIKEKVLQEYINIRNIIRCNLDLMDNITTGIVNNYIKKIDLLYNDQWEDDWTEKEIDYESILYLIKKIEIALMINSQYQYMIKNRK